MRISKIRDWMLVIASGFLLVSVLVVGYLMFLDGSVIDPVIQYESTMLPVQHSIYSPGDVVVARIQFYKSRDIVGEMKWNLVNHRIYPYSSKQISMPMGVADIDFPVEKLPEGCALGTYHFEGLVSYRVNPLRVVTYRLKTESFQIMPPILGTRE
jgi:hypothetical protein